MSSFITEKEILETRQRRQEEWEKVRRCDDPLERPEEPYDGRSLYDQLKEQKVKKDMEYEEAHKLKNLIRGLDDDEVQFLELIDQQKVNSEKKQLQEDKQELEDFRNRVANLQEESMNKKLQSELKSAKSKNIPIVTSARPSQKSLLSVGIKRKNGVMNAVENSLKPSNKIYKEAVKSTVFATSAANAHQYDEGSLKCVAVLPGIGSYTESSDSEVSTDSGEEIHGKYDLCGRKRLKKKQCARE